MDIQALRDEIRQFCEERDWRQYHNPKDLALALSIEASELMELFLWQSDADAIQKTAANKREAIEAEVADIAIYLLDLVEVMDLDLEQAIRRKLAHNREKYPIHLAKGKNLKYDELES